MTRGERLAFTELSNMKDLILKSADKGRPIVVQSRTDNLAEGYRQLADTKFYKKMEEDVI